MKVIITGTTGLVGGGVLLECLANKQIAKVLSVSRKPTGISHPKLEEYIVPDFLALKENDEKLQGYDACLFCAGISSVGMKEPEYTHITYDITMHFARILNPKPQMTFVYVSGAGTNSKEKGIMWTRVKGKTENELMKLPFKQVFAFRPGIMKAYDGQKNIPKSQKNIARFYSVLRAVFPNVVSTLQEVGQAMIYATQHGYDKKVIEVKDIHILSKKTMV